MRKDMVTRGFDATVAQVKVISKDTEEITSKTITLSKVFTGAKLTKAIEKVLSEDEVLLKVESTETAHKLFGMPTAQFLELAQELNPETRKAIETEDADEDEE